MLLFQENPVVFWVLSLLLIDIFDYNFLGLLSRLFAFLPGFSGPWRPPPSLKSSLTTYCNFLLPGRLFLLFLRFTTSATNLRRRFLPSSFFNLTLLSHIWCMHCLNLLLSRFPWEPAVLPLRLQGFPLWFETQTQTNCLFESFSYPQIYSHLKALFKLAKICS